VGVGSGGVTGYMARSPKAVPARPATAPSPFPGDHLYLPGVTTSALQRRMETHGYKCTRTRNFMRVSSLHPAEDRIGCVQSDTRVDISLYVANDTDVNKVQVSCEYEVAHPTVCDDFYLEVVPVFVGKAEDIKPVQAWVARHRRTDAEAVIDVIEVETTLEGGLSFAAIA
jgi:hypothetical protein